MRQISPLAYIPRRGTLQSASVGPVALYLGAYLVIAFLSSDPVVLLAATLGAAIAGYGCLADRAVKFSLRLGATLAIAMAVINAIVTDRGATVLARLGEWPLLGRVDITLESIAAGGIIGLRVMGTMVVIGVYSACVDPDRILRSLHRVARRSALTATLVSRLVPLAAADQGRLSEAATQRGPAATPVGRAAMAHRLLAGSLDRAVDVAATLELRGYGLGTRSRMPRHRRVAGEIPLLVCGLLSLVLLIAAGLGGVAAFDAYPRIEMDTGAATLGLAAAIVAFAWLPFALESLRLRRHPRVAVAEVIRVG